MRHIVFTLSYGKRERPAIVQAIWWSIDQLFLDIVVRITKQQYRALHFSGDSSILHFQDTIYSASVQDLGASSIGRNI